MKSGIEIYISLLLLVVMVLLCTGFIIADISAMDARNQFSAYVTKIENSDFAPSVMNACAQDASNNGYELNIEVLSIDGEQMAKVELTYTYKIPLLGLDGSEHTISGYAR